MIKGITAYTIPGIESLNNKSKPIEEELFLHLVEVLCKRYRISAKTMLSGIRQREAVYMRQLLAYWVRKTYPLTTWKNLGKMSGKSDHTTAMHSVNTFQDLIDTKASLPSRIRARFAQEYGVRDTKEEYIQTSKLLEYESRNFNRYIGKNK
jgi:chromosomal replication initiation ATPase DnaA